VQQMNAPVSEQPADFDGTWSASISIFSLLVQKCQWPRGGPCTTTAASKPTGRPPNALPQLNTPCKLVFFHTLQPVSVMDYHLFTLRAMDVHIILTVADRRTSWLICWPTRLVQHSAQHT
jgi:hypothetical protein